MKNLTHYIFKHRWNPLTVLTLLILSVSIIVFFSYIFQHFYYCAEDCTKLPWTVIAALAGAPWMLFLWFLRDYTKAQDLDKKQQEIDTKNLEIWQQDFHTQQVRATEWDNPSLQISAINILTEYYLDIEYPDHKESILRLLSALAASREQRNLSPIKDDIAKLISPVIINIIGTQNTSNKYWPGMILSGNLKDRDFRNYQLWGSRFNDSILNNAKFNKADVSYADFSNADLNETDFSSAYLQSTNFESVLNIEKAIFTGAQYSTETKFPAGFFPRQDALVLVRRGDKTKNEPNWIVVEN